MPVFALVWLAACSEPPPEPPDVLLVVIDTLRADHCSTYGYARRTTPQLDALAESGVLYTDTTAPSGWTWPSHASLFTGEPPWVNGAHFSSDPAHTIDLDKNRLAVSPLRRDLPTLAERFGQAGYRTAALYQNSFLHPVLGLTRGFSRNERHGDDIVTAVSEEMARPGRLFLFVNLTAPHSPYAWTPADWNAGHRAELDPATAPEWARPYLHDGSLDLAIGQRYRGFDLFARGELPLGEAGLGLVRDLYDGEVVKADRQVNQLVRAWKAAGRSGVVVVTSDHGEYLGEHGLLEHGRTVWSQLTHVPLVVVAPGRLPAGKVVDSPVQLQDVYPTLLSLAGLDHPAWSLVDAADGHPRPGPILAEEWADLYKADVGPPYTTGWTLYREGDRALVSARDGSVRQLYDVRADPQMAHDLASGAPDEVARLAGAAATAFPESESGSASGNLPDDAKQVLIQMGYLSEDEPTAPK